VCGRPATHAFGAGGAHDARDRRAERCLRHAIFHPRIRDRAARVAIVVGLALFAINQLDVVLSGGLSAIIAAKIALTFLVPYAVSTYSALQVSRLS
jgi:hypothetical protein